MARVYREIINNQIGETLADRNGARQAGNKILYRQLFNFHYADGAKMLTVGGLLYDQGLAARVESCGFEHIDFVKKDEVPFLIEPPNLTYREIRHLDTLLPMKQEEAPQMAGVPEADIKRYARLYRYFPHFAETEL